MLVDNFTYSLPEGINLFKQKLRKSVKEIIVCKDSVTITEINSPELLYWSEFIKNGDVYLSEDIMSYSINSEDPTSEKNVFSQEIISSVSPESIQFNIENSIVDNLIMLKLFNEGRYTIFFVLDDNNILARNENGIIKGFTCTIKSVGSLMSESNEDLNKLFVHLQDIEEVKQQYMLTPNFTYTDLKEEAKIQINITILSEWSGVNTLRVKVQSCGQNINTLDSKSIFLIAQYTNRTAAVTSLSLIGNGVYTIGIRDNIDGDDFVNGDELLLKIENDDYVSCEFLVIRNDNFITLNGVLNKNNPITANGSWSTK